MSLKDRKVQIGGAVLLVAVVALVVALTVGSESENETQADIGAFVECFDSELLGFEESEEDVDLIAQGAGVGAVQLTDDNQEIQVVAERTPGDAENTVGEYEGFGLGQVEQYGTVVVAANNSMTDREQDAIETCLDEQGVG